VKADHNSVHPPRLPRAYILWMFGAVASQFGDAVLYFAVGWAATAHGGSAAGLTLSAVSFSRVALLLIGGVSGDRWGARRVMICCDAVMLLGTGGLAVVTWRHGTPLGLLVATAITIGVIDAFYIPSSGSMPRRLVADALLTKAVGARQVGAQLVTVVGGPVGGILVAFAGFTATALADAATFALVLVVLVAIRDRIDVPIDRSRNLVEDLRDGWRVVARAPGLRAALLLVAAAAGFVIPTASLLIPMLARQRGWGVGSAGLLVGAHAIGTIMATVIVGRRPTAKRASLAAVGGIALTGIGAVGLALSPEIAIALTWAAIGGAGTGLFVIHLTPVLLATTPRSHLARVQSIVTVVQSGSLLVSQNLLGAVSDRWSAATALLCCAGMLGITAGLGCASRSVRAQTGATSATE
jgi:predicted MFS family arabinose efflux permease